MFSLSHRFLRVQGACYIHSLASISLCHLSYSRDKSINQCSHANIELSLCRKSQTKTDHCNGMQTVEGTAWGCLDVMQCQMGITL